MPPHALRTTYELDPRTEPLPTADPLCRWAAGHPDGGSRAFVRGAAVAVAAPGLSMRDRLVVTGPPGDAVPLARDALEAVGPGYRPLGDRALIDAVVARLPGLHPVAAFGWMDRSATQAPPTAAESPHPTEGPSPADTTGPAPATARPTPPARPSSPAAWLTEDDEGAVGALLDAAFPESYAYPGRPGARHRWAGVRDGGRLAAVAALAWCAPTVGFLAGVATAPAARSRGLGRVVCAFTVERALAEYGTAALIVDDANAAALRLYRGLGLAYRPLGAARPSC